MSLPANKPLASLASLALVSAALLLAGSAWAGPVSIYLYEDADGVVHLSTSPVHGGYQRISSEEAAPAAKPEGASAPLGANARQIQPIVEQYARQAGLQVALVNALIHHESGFNPAAVSRKGARGLMQVMPGTALRYGIKDLFDPAENVRAGTLYLRDLLRMFKDDVPLALAAYNAGEGAVLRVGGRIPPYEETRRYVPDVLRLYRNYQRQDVMPPSAPYAESSPAYSRD